MKFTTEATKKHNDKTVGQKISTYLNNVFNHVQNVRNDSVQLLGILYIVIFCIDNVSGHKI